MKFHQLRPGAHFRFDGRTYRKISPLQASDDVDGTRRMVPRSAKVIVLDEGGSRVEALPETLDRGSVETAIAQLHHRLVKAIDRIDPALQPAQQAWLRRAIEEARDDALNRLMSSNTRPAADDGQ